MERHELGAGAVRLEAVVDGAALQAQLEALHSAVQDAANRAVERQTGETLGQIRNQIAGRLSTRAAGTITSKLYVNMGGEDGPHGSVGGWIHSRWWRRPAGGGEQIDLLAAFARGGVILPRHGGALACALPAAYNVLGLSAGYRRSRKPVTPQAVEIALGGEALVPVRSRSTGNLVLCAANVAVSRRSGKVRTGTYTSKRGRLVRRAGIERLVPMFVLLRRTALPKRLDFAQIRDAIPDRLAEKFLVELAARAPD